MTQRQLFQGRKREYLSVSISTNEDRELLEVLRQRAKLSGISLRSFVLNVLDDYVKST